MSTITNILKNREGIGTWRLDQEASSFTFKNKSFWGLASVKGQFTDFSGEGQIADDGTVSGRVDIKVASVNTKIGKRDNHLRSADFFDAENFPEMTVTVTGVDPVDDDEVNVRADLSARGNTVALPMRARVTALDDGAVRLTGTTTVEREQLGVSGNMAGMISPTTTLSADAVFRRSS